MTQYFEQITINNKEMKQKSHQASSEGDRSFNFKYKIDLQKKGHTGGSSIRQESGYEFEDFKDLRQDKTQKSQIYSQKKWLPSQLVKKSQESLIITENATELSIKKKGGSFLAQIIYKNSEQPSINDEYNFISNGTSPKFINEQKSYQTATNGFFPKNKQEDERSLKKIKMSTKLPMANILTQNENNNIYYSTKMNHQTYSPLTYEKNISYNVSSSRKNQQGINKLTNRITPQMQFKDLLSSIQFFQSENQKIDYETSKLMQELEKYSTILEDNTSYQYQIKKLTDQTYTLNTEISNQRSIERKLIEDYNNLEEQFDQVVVSVQNFKFQRPEIIKDQTKAIIDEINSLKAQFDSLKRDQGSLNLSNTLQNPLSNMPSLEHRFQIGQVKKKFNPEQNLMKQNIIQILQNSKQTPNYIYNIKMMAVKDEWLIFENTQICVNCCSRNYPLIQFRIGNKSVKNLNDFMLKEGSTVIAEKQILTSKSYYIHTFTIGKIIQPFIKISLQYKVNELNGTLNPTVPKSLKFFIPTLPFKYGQFIPITKKQYEVETNQHQNMLEQMVVYQKHIDTLVIKRSIQQLLLFFPNLLIDNNDKDQTVTCRGIFKLWNSHQGSLVKIKQRGFTVSIFVKNNVKYLIESLEFLLTDLV